MYPFSSGTKKKPKKQEMIEKQVQVLLDVFGGTIVEQ